MARRENLQVRISARDDASRVLQRAQDRVLNVNTASKASFRETGNVAEQTFTRIQQDVQLATADYERGVISLQEYTEALRFARQEALELKAGGLQPVGSELKAFNSVVRATGGAAETGVRGTGRLRRSFASLAAVSVGLPGRLGTIAGVMSQFAFGSLAAAGVFAGLAGVALGFKEITEEARESKEATEEAVQAIRGQSETLQRIQEDEQARLVRERQNIIQRLLQEGRTEFAGAGGGLLGVRGEEGVQVGVGDEERRELIDELHQNTIALRDLGRKREDEAKELARLDRIIGQEVPETPDLGAPGTLDRLLLERIGGPEFQLRAHQLGRQAFVSPLAGAGRALTPTAGRAPGLLPAAAPEFGRERDRMLEDLRIVGPLEEAGREIKGAGEKAGEDVEVSGQQLIRGLGQVSTALAGMITGKRSIVGGLGSTAFGLSSLFEAGSGAGLGIGIAGIGLGFIDALTSDKNKKAQEEAHLNALRRHETEKPPATIVLRVPNQDPRSAEYQRLVDETRREAEARGYNVNVERRG